MSWLRPPNRSASVSLAVRAIEDVSLLHPLPRELPAQPAERVALSGERLFLFEQRLAGGYPLVMRDYRVPCHFRPSSRVPRRPIVRGGDGRRDRPGDPCAQKATAAPPGRSRRPVRNDTPVPAPMRRFGRSGGMPPPAEYRIGARPCRRARRNAAARGTRGTRGIGERGTRALGPADRYRARDRGRIARTTFASVRHALPLGEAPGPPAGATRPPSLRPRPVPPTSPALAPDTDTAPTSAPRSRDPHDRAQRRLAALRDDAGPGDDLHGPRHGAGAHPRDRCRARRHHRVDRPLSIDRLRRRGDPHAAQRLARAPLRRHTHQPGERGALGNRRGARDHRHGAGHRAGRGPRRDGLRAGDPGSEPRARPGRAPRPGRPRILDQAVRRAARGAPRGALLPPVAERFGWGGSDRALEPHGGCRRRCSSSRSGGGSTTIATPRTG